MKKILPSQFKFLNLIKPLVGLCFLLFIFLFANTSHALATSVSNVTFTPDSYLGGATTRWTFTLNPATTLPGNGTLQTINVVFPAGFDVSNVVAEDIQLGNNFGTNIPYTRTITGQRISFTAYFYGPPDLLTAGSTGTFTISNHIVNASVGTYSASGFTIYTGLDTTPVSVSSDITLNPSPPTVTSPTSASITGTTATLGGNVTSDGGGSVTERGVCIKTSANPTTSDTCFTTTGTTGVFTVSATGLSEATTYHYRAYAINSAGTSYASDSTFGTLGSPVATTGAASSIGQTSATLNGTITANSATTTVTFKYGTVADLSSGTTTVTATGSPVASSGSNVAVTYALSGLSGTTTYYFRVIAVNSEGTTNGDILSFTTDSAPTVTSPTSASITGTAATLGGNVTSDGGDTVTGRGVCVSTSANPTTSGTCFTTSGTTGVFTVSATNLLSGVTYHYRAYATNSIGTSYSSDDTFTTLARYWIGGTGNWSDTAHWSASSGGAGGASLPDSTQMAYFDANSFSTTGQTVTINMNAVSGGMNWTGALYNPTLDIDTGHTITIGGSLTLIQNMTIDGDETNNVHIIEFTGSGSYTITMAGHSFPVINLGASTSGINFGTSGTWNLLDDFDQRHANVRFGGTFITNNHDINVRWVIRNGGSTPSLYLGTSTFGLYDYWLAGGANNFAALNTENATLEIHPDADFAGMNFAGGTTHWKTIHAYPAKPNYHVAWGYMTGNLVADTLILEGDSVNGWYPMPNSFTDFEYPSISEGVGATFTIGELIINGSADALVEMTGTLTTTAQISADYMNVHASTCTGVTPCYAGSHSFNGGGNTGWVFSAPPATATTVDASSVTTSGATVSGTANGKGDSAVTSFVYGTSPTLSSGTTTVTATQSPVTGSSDTSVSYALTGLNPGTTYYYRVSITNSYGTTNGSILSFTTSSLPSSGNSSSTVAIPDPGNASYWYTPQQFSNNLVIAGASGGNISSSNGGANLNIPAGASSSDTFFWLAPRTNADILAGNSVAGKVSSIPSAVLNSSTSKIYELDPSNLSNGEHISTLSKPVTMTLNVDSITANTKIYFFDTVTKKWTLLDKFLVTSESNKTVSFVTDKAGLYVAVNEASSSPIAQNISLPEETKENIPSVGIGTATPTPTKIPVRTSQTVNFITGRMADLGVKLIGGLSGTQNLVKGVGERLSGLNLPFGNIFKTSNSEKVLAAADVNILNLLRVGPIDHLGIFLSSLGNSLIFNPTQISEVKVVASTPTSMTVSWKTNNPATSKINYGETLDFGEDLQSNERVENHELTIKNLKPDTTYYYEVMSQGKGYVYDAHHTFKTPGE